MNISGKAILKRKKVFTAERCFYEIHIHHRRYLTYIMALFSPFSYVTTFFDEAFHSRQAIFRRYRTTVR